MILASSNKLVNLLEFESNDEKALNNTMNVLKSGLLSDDFSTASLSGRVITKVS